MSAVLRSGRLAQGPMAEALERRFAELCSIDHAVAVNSGTTALVAALRSLDIGPGDEVLTSAVVVTDTPEAQRAAAEVLSLPVHSGITTGDVDRIVDAVRRCLE